MVFKPLDSIDFDLGDLDPMLLTPREKERERAGRRLGGKSTNSLFSFQFESPSCEQGGRQRGGEI